MFKTKDWYKLEVKTSEAMKVFGSTRKLVDKTNNEKNVPNLEVI